MHTAPANVASKIAAAATLATRLHTDATSIKVTVRPSDTGFVAVVLVDGLDAEKSSDRPAATPSADAAVGVLIGLLISKLEERAAEDAEAIEAVKVSL